MKIKISKPNIPKPNYKKLLPRKKKEAFASEKKRLLKNIKKHSENPDLKLVGKAFSFISRLPRIRKRRHERKLVEKAFSFSKEKHKKQKRQSGNPYFVHAYRTAFILSNYGLDSETISAALLHDVLEDTDVREKELRKAFGEEVFSLVKGVTKLKEYDARGEEPEQAYLKNLLCASSEDVRVLLIKLADKLHNIRTVQYLPKKRRKEICSTALEVYAPLAERFGLHEMKKEIEDKCFEVLEPKKFKKTKKMVEKRRKQKEKEIDQVIEKLSNVKIGTRKRFFQKHSYRKSKRNIYSYYEKTKEEGKAWDELYDFVSLIILCDSEEDCYEALKTVHSEFYPIPGKFKDRIATPSPMTYQSIHTAVIGPNGNPIKIIIRTKKMDKLAEKGITVWLREKRKKDLTKKKTKPFIEISKRSTDQEEFVYALKTDILEDQISVFGPRGEKINLPLGSTPVDFAFKFSPKRANRLARVEVNGKLKPVWTRLKNGDRIKPTYSRKKMVEKEWLDFSNTYYAREMIRDELDLSEKRTPQKKLSYCFTTQRKKNLLEKIHSILQDYDTALENLELKRISLKKAEGKLVLLLKNPEKEKEIIEKLNSLQGIKQTN